MNCTPTQVEQPPEELKDVPVIYSTDLWLPHGDPDDHFDLVSLASLPQIDLKAVILDYTMQANVKRTGIEKEPNFGVVEKVAKLFGKSPIPTESGLIEPLNHPEDQGMDRPEEEQGAIRLILEQLERVEDESAIIIIVGSARDVIAAYNRNPKLFEQKLKGIYISLGDSYGVAGIEDTNVAKDIQAWKRLMVSGLPVSWMPTNPSKRRGPAFRYTSFWYFVQEDVLMNAPQAIQEFFLSEGIGLSINSPRPVRPMWSTPAFIESAGLKCYDMDGELYWWSPKKASENPGASLVSPYSFVPVAIDMKESGEITWEETDQPTSVHIFKMNDYFLYHESMTQFLHQQFNQ